MTYAAFWKRLAPLYGEGEAKAIARMVYASRYGLTLADLLMGRDSEVPHEELQQLLQRLEQGEPVQYVLGEEQFCGRRFKVTPDVLIPRPETQELCQWIVEEATHHAPLPVHRLLDIGTGSGCIAVTLALELPQAHVTAWDISDHALAVARENAQRLGAAVTFQQVDALHLFNPLTFSPFNPLTFSPFNPLTFSLIVSNPPYICEQEKAHMAPNVLDHEPSLALFVPDDDPLLFYRSIARYAREALVPGGQLFFEINPLYRDELTAMLRDMGYTHIETRADQFGLQRMLKAQTP